MKYPLPTKPTVNKVFLKASSTPFTCVLWGSSGQKTEHVKGKECTIDVREYQSIEFSTIRDLKDGTIEVEVFTIPNFLIKYIYKKWNFLLDGSKPIKTNTDKEILLIEAKEYLKKRGELGATIDIYNEKNELQNTEVIT